MRPLPLLTPCHEPWTAMRGDDRSRHCAACDRSVHDLSAGTEDRALAVLALLGPLGLCVRYETGPGDVIRHAPSGPPRAALAAGLLAAAVTAGCAAPAPPSARSPVATIAEPGLRARADCAPGTVRGEAGDCVAPARADTDGDGVPDAQDACPGAPGPRSDDPARNGCPFLGVVVVPQEIVITAQPARFAPGASKLPRESEALIDAIAAVLIEHPEIRKVMVTGHASGDEKDAVRLGEARARAVIAALAARKVDVGRLVAGSAGSREPVAPDTTAEGRARNRRVELRVEAGSAEGAQAGGVQSAGTP